MTHGGRHRWPTPPSLSPSGVRALPELLLGLEYGTPFRTSEDFATSQGEVNFDVPTGLNCTEQFAGSATTVTGAVFSAASSAGLA